MRMRQTRAAGVPQTRALQSLLEPLRLLAAPLKAVYGLGFAALTLPLGLVGDRSVRRHPWVSYAILLLCVAGFQYTLVAEPGPEWEQAYDESAHRLTTFLRENPCVQAPRDLTDSGDSAALRAFEEARARACGEQPSASASPKMQTELDRRVAAFRAISKAHPVYRFCERAADGPRFTIFTAMFLHSGWFHLIGNLLFFYVVGPFIEDVYGRASFAALYLMSGLGAALLQHHLDPGSTLFSLGASGAISGVLGAFLVRFTTRRLQLLSVASLWLPVVRYRFSVPAYIFLGVWFLRQLAGAQTGSDHVGWWAHIGGFSFGVAFALAYKGLRIEEERIAPAVDRQITFHAHPALERAMDLRLEGQFHAAHRSLEQVLATDPDNLDAWRERYELAVAEGQAEEASQYATRLNRLYLKEQEHHLAVRLTEDALDRLGTQLPPRFYIVAAAQMRSAGETPLARQLHECLQLRHPHLPASALSVAQGGSAGPQACTQAAR